MAKIIILGSGAMSSAFAVPCIENKHNTIVVGSYVDDQLIEKINQNNNFHPVLKVNLPKKIKFIKHKNLYQKKYQRPDLIVIGTNSKGIEWSAKQLENFCVEKKIPPILLLTKGLSIYNNKFELLIEKLKRLLSFKKLKKINISALGGPCLALDLAKKFHSSVIIANKDLKTSKWLQKLISTNYYHVSLSDDIIGVEVCSAIKNIFSMIMGSSKGLNKKKKKTDKKEINYLNTSAALFSQCVYEMEIFVSFLKGKKETVKGLAGIGDLYVSAVGGRNSLMGSFLGEGFSYSKIKEKKMKNITVEGADLAFKINKLVNKNFNIKEMPLMITMIDSIVNNKKVKIKWQYFN